MQTRAVFSLIALVAALFLIAFTLAGCGGVDAQYMGADRLTKTALDPRLDRYGADHPEDMGVAGVRSMWEFRLKQAEASTQPAK